MNQPSFPALTRLRELILRGVLAPGERLLEVDLAARLDLSRTPIRQALPALAQEGLLVPAGGRGYRVRAFTRQESLQALHLRATLEGFAARTVVLAGTGTALAEILAPILADGDAVLASAGDTDAIEDDYGRMNARFHDAVVAAAASPLLADLIARCNIVPFAAPRAVAFEQHGDADIRDLLGYAHRQHHAIVNAFAGADATRAEMLFREHATTQESSMASARLAP